MDPNDDSYLGHVAYDGYLNASRGVSLVSGQPLPGWDDQSEKIQKAWVAAAVAVQRAIPGSGDEVGVKFAAEDQPDREG